MKEKKYKNGILIKDKRELTPDNSTAVPNDLMDKYLKLFKGKKLFNAVMDLIQQSYKAGLQIGREEITQKYEKLLDNIYH